MDVAVVIATYNQAEYVADAIESVLAQTRPPAEIVVTDDGSTDGTQAIVDEYASQYPNKITTSFSERNVGIPANLNDGLERVNSDSVTFLAGDDRYRPRKLEIECAKMDTKQNIGVVFSNFVYVDDDGNVIGRWANRKPPTGYALKETLTRDWPGGTLYRNPLVSMSVINDVGYFDKSLPIYEDWDLKIRLAANTELAYCDEVLTEYRQHSAGISSQSDVRLHAEMYEKIFAKNSELLSKLSERERRDVKREFGGQIHRFRAFADKQEGNWSNALYEYLEAIRTQPKMATNYKKHLELMLPKQVFAWLVEAKRLAQP